MEKLNIKQKQKKQNFQKFVKSEINLLIFKIKMDNYSSDEDIDFAIYQRRHRQTDRSQRKVSFYREVAKRIN